MLSLLPGLSKDGPLRLLCIGAHSDDIEIGCAGTLLSWLATDRPLHVTWVVLSGDGARETEARRSAGALLRRAAGRALHFGGFRDGYLPTQHAEVKQFIESVRSREPAPHLVFTHRLEDRHQDHRLAAELTWNTWRNHLVLEYEIAKYEGDLGQPNLYVPLSAREAARKATHLRRHFGTQRSKDWFTDDTFLALTRLRGIECRAAGGHAEAFHARKLVLGIDGG